MRFLVLTLLFLAGCSSPEPFTQRPTSNSERPRLTINNEHDGALYMTFARHDEAGERLDVPAWGEATLELDPGHYHFELFIEGRRGFPAKMFNAARKGAVDFEAWTRYAFRYRPR